MSNNIVTAKLGLDTAIIKNSCGIMYDYIKEKFSENKKDYNGQSTMTTQLFSSYNLLMYPLPGFHELFFGIRDTFLKNYPECNDHYYLQSWVNFYQKGDFIDWHWHWPDDANAYHGFYCVDTEPSHTSYVHEDHDIQFDIPSKDDQVVMSKSYRERHRTWPWTEDRPRITIAFDIVPRSAIKPLEWANHWIPLSST
jgi:hypothetical protein